MRCIQTDAVVIGAGPVGLFQVFQLGLLEVKAHVIDTLSQPGGQCIALYPDKPIYDIPAVPVCTGRELTARLLQQIAPLGAEFHFGQEVSTVQRQADGLWLLETSRGTRFLSKTVFIAAGVGAFQPRRLALDGLARFAGTQLFYGMCPAAEFAQKNVLVVGSDDVALDWACRLCTGDDAASGHRAASVTLLHRRDHFNAAPELVTRMRALCQTQAMQLVVGQISAVSDSSDSQGQMTHVEVTGVDGQPRVLALDLLLVFLGLSPKLGPLADWGLQMERKQLLVDTATLATSEPGIFAVGDINTYPGKKKLMVCGFHESTLAAYAAMPIIFPGKHVPLQYTTTSPRLHQILGVAAADVDGADAEKVQPQAKMK